MFLKTLAGVAAAIALAACTPAGRDKIVNVEGDAFMGPADAKVTVVEYGSPTCPGCKYWHDTFWEEVKRDYIDTGKIKFIFREYAIHGPIDIGIFSVARCAGTEDYFAVLDEAFATQRDIVTEAGRGDSIPALRKLGGKFRLSPEQVDACIADPKNVTRVNDVGAYARSINVNSTPTFFVAGTLMTEPSLEKSWEQMKVAIEAALTGQPVPAPIAPPADAVAPAGDGHAPGDQH